MFRFLPLTFDERRKMFGFGGVGPMELFCLLGMPGTAVIALIVLAATNAAQEHKVNQLSRMRWRRFASCRNVPALRAEDEAMRHGEWIVPIFLFAAAPWGIVWYFWRSRRFCLAHVLAMMAILAFGLAGPRMYANMFYVLWLVCIGSFLVAMKAATEQ